MIVPLMLVLMLCSGCYVPLRSPATPATCLPDTYRTPIRSYLPAPNLAALVVPKPVEYLLGPDDVLEVTVRGLTQQPEPKPIHAQVMADGTVTLPLAGRVSVQGMNVGDAQRVIDDAYKRGLVNPRVSVALLTKASMDVTVVGSVTKPGVYALPRYQNDIAHAIGLAGGLTDFAADEIEIHRRVSLPTETPPPAEPKKKARQRPRAIRIGQPVIQQTSSIELIPPDPHPDDPSWVDLVIRVPLRGGPTAMMIHGQEIEPGLIPVGDLSLQPRDIISIPRKVDPVFFVVGPLSQVNAVNFTVSDRDRQLGNAFILPPDRDIDVVTAVTMAGYIDPIESPSTVTIHRTIPGRAPKLIRVDLIAARYDWSENIYVAAGDIIYLNPDAAWWWRRTIDRVIPEMFVGPYIESMRRWINPFQFN